MKYFVFSDVHSCYDLMINELNRNGFDINNEDHKIIFVGDAFDKGDKPLETYLYFKSLIDKNKMIWILGNHDVEFINFFKNKKFSKARKDTVLKIAKYYDDSINENSDINKICEVLIDNKVLDLLENKTCDYYELDKYVFTHGFIPTQNGKYFDKWREVESSKWNSIMVRSGNGVRMVLKDGIKIPGKTLVCGHTGAYFGRILIDNPTLDVKSKEFSRLKSKYSKDFNNYHTFKSDDVINLDGNCYKTGVLNILILEVKNNNGE